MADVPQQRRIRTDMPARIIGWDMAVAGDVVSYIEGTVDDKGILTIDKMLIGAEAHAAIIAAASAERP